MSHSASNPSNNMLSSYIESPILEPILSNPLHPSSSILLRSWMARNSQKLTVKDMIEVKRLFELNKLHSLRSRTSNSIIDFPLEISLDGTLISLTKDLGVSPFGYFYQGLSERDQTVVVAIMHPLLPSDDSSDTSSQESEITNEQDLFQKTIIQLLQFKYVIQYHTCSKTIIQYM